MAQPSSDSIMKMISMSISLNFLEYKAVYF